MDHDAHPPRDFDPAHTQRSHRVRCEWGPTGAQAVPADYAVVNQLFEEKFGGNAGRKATPFILVNAPVCRPGWLIEMECMATKAISSDYPKF